MYKKKSISSFCLKPLTTSLVLNFSIVLSGFNFFLSTHLHPIVLQPRGKSTSFQVLLEIRESISSLMASFQKSESVEDKAASKEVGSLCKLYT